MNKVQGFLDGFRLVGVRAPLLSTGDGTSSVGPPVDLGAESETGDTGVFFPETDACSPSAASLLLSLSARSRSFFSFLRSRFSLSFSPLSGTTDCDPFGLSSGVIAESLVPGVPRELGITEVALPSLLVRWGGVDLSGAGVETLVGGCDALFDGRVAAEEPGVDGGLFEAVLR